MFFSFSPDFSFSSLRFKEEKEKKGKFRTQMKFQEELTYGGYPVLIFFVKENEKKESLSK